MLFCNTETESQPWKLYYSIVNPLQCDMYVSGFVTTETSLKLLYLCQIEDLISTIKHLSSAKLKLESV